MSNKSSPGTITSTQPAYVWNTNHRMWKVVPPFADSLAVLKAYITDPSAYVYWSTPRHIDEIKAGDTAYIFRSVDRPGIVARVVDELKSLGVEQILVVSAATESHRPHALTPPRIDGRSRLGEYLQSSEAAAVRDATYLGAGPSARVFTISPEHNPMGPFDFAGAFDDRSDRAYGLEELMARGYEDAYRQFIEPVVGASGERLKVKR